ncbi:hypothetical protein EDB85DRAFT_1956831 [Lactarius pseudohatsudake]|nr:hypothetical protein EDB85DRAFT_1956831 [Lactarius pseudohatsudake]
MSVFYSLSIILIPVQLAFCKFSLYVHLTKHLIPQKVNQIISLPTIQKVFSLYCGHLSLAYDIYLFSSPPPVLAVII